MDSYIEVTWINAFIVITFSLFVSSYLTFQPLAIKKILNYTIVIISSGLFIWNQSSLLIMIGLESMFCFTLFHWHLRCYLLALGIRYFLYCIEYFFLSGSFHNLLYFAPICFKVIYIWILVGLGFLILLSNGKQWFVTMQYSYPFTLYIGDKRCKLIGYLDSGNLVTFHQIPVIFLDCMYKSYFLTSKIECIQLETVSGKEMIVVYQAKLKLEHGSICDVYVNVEKKLSREFGASCILNRNLFMVR